MTCHSCIIHFWFVHFWFVMLLRQESPSRRHRPSGGGDAAAGPARKLTLAAPGMLPWLCCQIPGLVLFGSSTQRCATQRVALLSAFEVFLLRPLRGSTHTRVYMYICMYTYTCICIVIPSSLSICIHIYEQGSGMKVFKK